VKHYALNNDEENRHQVNVIVSDRALHEIYLPAFRAAVTEGKAWALMGAYNLYKNQHNCHNEQMLMKILKGEWNFDGVVVSDWGGCHDTDEAVKNGLDMEFGSWTNGLSMGKSNAYDNYYMALPYLKAIQSGKYTTKELDDKVRRVLRLFFRTTMNHHRPTGFLCSESHYDAARKIAQQGIVLLQNKDNVLPLNLNRTKRILVVGENAIKMMTVGGGSSSLKVQKEISPLDGLKSRLGNAVQVDYERGYVGDTTGAYNGVTTGQDLTEKRSADQLIADAVKKAAGADYVIFFGGLNKSDFQDCEGHDRKSYDLPYGQGRVIEALAKVNKHLVFVSTWRADHKIIDEEYKEGLYVGYRWVDKEKTHPLFAFGHGLSYTSFALTNLRASAKIMSREGNITFTVNVKNTGKRDGAETVQLYIHDVKSSLDRPYKELKGFQKVELKAGESRDVEITIDNRALSFYDDRAQAWTSEAGDFVALVGDASDNLPLQMNFKLQ
jgi:hypothetical protein